MACLQWNVFRNEYLTTLTQIHLHKQYIFDTHNIQSEYAFLFPFSIQRHYIFVKIKPLYQISKLIWFFMLQSFWFWVSSCKDIYANKQTLLEEYPAIV